MKKNMNQMLKKMSAILLAGTMVISLAACGGSAKKDSGKLAEIKEKGKVVMCTDAAWAPFEYIGANGEVTGVDVEIANKLAEGMGVELEIVNMSFDSIASYLASGEADMALACITITDERKEEMEFSTPYTTVQQYMVVMADDDTDTMDALAGKAVGTHLGTTGDFLMADEIEGGVLKDTGAENKQYKALPDAALAMKSGELQAVVCDSVLAENLVKSNGDAFKCFPVKYADGTEVDVEEIGVAVPKGETEFIAKINEILEPMIKDGSVDEFYVKHSEEASKID